MVDRVRATTAFALAMLVSEYGIDRHGRLRGRRLRAGVRRHLPQRGPPLLLTRLRQPVRGGRAPGPGPAARAVRTQASER